MSTLISTLSTAQVAELLLGVARSQLAIAEAMESARPGFKATHLRSNVEAAARIKMNRPETLVDFPSRLLLKMLGRNTPSTTDVVADLQALLADISAVESSDSLDMTK